VLIGNTNRGVGLVGGARRAVGGARDPGGGLVAWSFLLGGPGSAGTLRDRRQRRGGPAGRHQPEPDPGRSRSCLTGLTAGIMGIIFAS
jgi:hypothetical protein